MATTHNNNIETSNEKLIDEIWVVPEGSITIKNKRETLENLISAFC